ncbi:MAG: DNA-binding response regulator [Magnetovibrio sp.]|nr:DNA-binding response regulator [Magnetovibrio sp.]|tara:strand:+ start:469 stop:1167 length:699 start_codon:yes stop_codon:yes gene_type:complete
MGDQVMNSRVQILIVGSDSIILDIFSTQTELRKEFFATGVNSGEAALKSLGKNHYDVIVFDTNLSDMNWCEFYKAMYGVDVNSPIIILTDAELNKKEASKEVAVEYLCKPFKFYVLLSMIRTQIWQQEYTGNKKLMIGPYIFFPSDKTLQIAPEEKKIRLTDKETDILRFLLQAGEKITSREALLDEVWGYNSNVATHTLETHIYRLRQKIKLSNSNTQIILTERGGYRLAK